MDRSPFKTPNRLLQRTPLKFTMDSQKKDGEQQAKTSAALSFSPDFDLSPIERRTNMSRTISTSPIARRDDVEDCVDEASLEARESPIARDLEEPEADPSEEESIALARMLMAQEAMESYGALSADFLRYNANQYSAEDLQALEAALEEDDRGAGFLEEVEEEEEEMGYEMMLRIGEAIGDVKQERWAMVSKNHIAKLCKYKFTSEDVAGVDPDDSRCKCLVCQFSYEEQETLRRLPCGHCFHSDCIDEWLTENNKCAYCRQPIVDEEG